MKQLIAAGAFTALTFASGVLVATIIPQPGDAQEARQPTEAERMATSPMYQLGCRMGERNMGPPSIPRRFIDSDQAEETVRQIYGYVYCKANKQLAKDADEAQRDAAQKAADDEFARFTVILSETAKRGPLVAPKPAAAKR